MSQHRKGAILTLIVAAVFVALDEVFGISLGPAGVFVLGVGGGLLIGEAMSKVQAHAS